MKQLTILLFLVLLTGCSKQNCYKKSIPLYADSSISDINGKPLDSLTLFFPKALFYDTFKYIFYKDDTLELKYSVSADTFIKQRGLDKDSILNKDSIRIDEVIFFARLYSFSLFKMDEPILYNFDLNREIYRLIVSRSFHKFFVFHLEKNNDSIYIITKGLNRHVGYPFIQFMKCPPEFLFSAPGEKELSKYERERFQAKQDSMDKAYNNTNYYIDSIIVKKLSIDQWDTLESKLEIARFWESNPETCGGCLQIDGSRWIIEGHNKCGYQIKEVLSPFDSYDKNLSAYDYLFRYIVNISGLDTTKFRFY
jgi:hypothetical protein